MATIGEKITSLALEQLKKHPDGVRYADLVRIVRGVNHLARSGVWRLTGKSGILSL